VRKNNQLLLLSMGVPISPLFSSIRLSDAGTAINPHLAKGINKVDSEEIFY
jgi:hypothetical protein